MKRILFSLLLAASLSAEAQTQTYETEFARPLNEVLADIQNRFGIRLKSAHSIMGMLSFSTRPYPPLFCRRIFDECVVTIRLQICQTER